MNEVTKVAGGCLCGAVRYEAEVYLDRAYYCHCRMCQKSTGSPAEISVFVKPETLRFPHEEPKYYQSSAYGRRGFCPHCGSRLIWLCPERPEWTNLAVGCLDHPENVVPSEHIYVETQLPWYKIDDGLPRKRSDELPKLDTV